MNYTLSVLLENKPGAPARVVGLLSARGYNIESLVVMPTGDPLRKRMIVCLDLPENKCEQTLRQVEKIVYVLHATGFSEPRVS